MPAFNFFDDFKERIADDTHDLDGTDTIKVALTNVAPVATNTQLSNITEIAAGNGYTAGGNVTTAVLSETGGVGKITLSDVTFTASGGAMADFRYAVVYNDTATNDELIGWVDNGSTVSLANTETFQVKFDQTNGAIRIA